MLNARYIELILYKTYSDLRADTEKTYIGILWWIMDPILFMAIFYLVFGLLLDRKQENFVQFLLIGLVIWRWFQSTVMHSANAISGNKWLMRQVYLPKIIFPVVTILTDLVKFILVFVILLIFFWLSGFPIEVYYIALPMIMVAQFALIVATSCFVAALVPFFPDLKVFVEHILHLFFFLSGIFYPGTSIPVQYQFYFYLNPMANIIESYRNVLMYNQWPSWTALAVILIVSLLALTASYWLIKRFDQDYPKTIF